MTRFVLAVILIGVSALVGGNVAIAASSSDQPQSEAKATTLNMPDIEFTQFRHAANSSQTDPRVPFEVAQWGVTNVCYTPAGSCYVPPAPLGTPCACYIGGLWYPGSH